MTQERASVCDVSQRFDWPALLERAAAIVESYDTLVTLRQLFYRLVMALLLPNTLNAYKALSRHSAAARRDGTFPALMDRGRTIHRYRTFASPAEAQQWLQGIYRRDRTEGQPCSLYLGVEKAGIVAQMMEWFGDPFGIPIVPFGGYSSEPLERDVIGKVRAAGRPAVLLQACDCDASGEDIDRNFIAQTDCWDVVRRVALTADQVRAYGLPKLPGKADANGHPSDSRAHRFIARHGEYFQVELDALDPNDLRALFAAAIAEFWDDAAYQRALQREAAERGSLGSRG